MDIFDIFKNIEEQEKKEEEVVEIEEEVVEVEEEEETIQPTEENPFAEAIDPIVEEDDSKEVVEEEEETSQEEIKIEVGEIETEEVEEEAVEEDSFKEPEVDVTTEEIDQQMEDERPKLMDYDFIEIDFINAITGCTEVNKENLKKLVMDDLKYILDELEIEYLSNDRKGTLINLILGEEDEEETETESEETSEEETSKERVQEVIEDIKVKREEIDGPKKKVSTSVVDNIVVEIPVTDMQYMEAVGALRPSFVDEQWNTYKVEIDQRLGDIIIEDDMNPGTLKLVIAELSALRQEVWYNYQSTKTLYETLGSKEPEGLIERVKKMAFNPSDRNDMERKRTQVEACVNFVDPNTRKNINLFEVLDETRERYNFLKATIDSIQYKTNALITMNGALKLEKSHLD